MAAFAQLQSPLEAQQRSGMLDPLEQRFAQAEAERLGFLDFLEVLLEDEVQRRARTSLAACLARAHVEAVKTFEEFDCQADPRLPRPQRRDLATCRFLEAPAAVVICGPVGAGQTHAATALGVAACRRGDAVRFTNLS